LVASWIANFRVVRYVEQNPMMVVLAAIASEENGIAEILIWT
jgi:hypothetical protein